MMISSMEQFVNLLRELDITMLTAPIIKSTTNLFIAALWSAVKNG